ncbi:MAG: hypothetical protein WCT04_28110, partial [Planctomycetota bacterium]
STATPFARRFTTRLAATLGIVLAASWGPLSHVFQFVEVSDSSSTRSVRIVLARDCVFNHAPRKAKPATAPVPESENKSTERVLNATPDLLESVHPIHFDLSSVPALARVSAWSGASRVYVQFDHGAVPESSESIAHAARGPPNS